MTTPPQPPPEPPTRSFQVRLVKASIAVLVTLVVAAVIIILVFCLGGNDTGRKEYSFVPSSYDWKSFEQFYPVAPGDLIALPSATPEALPIVQFAFEDVKTDDARDRREILASRADAVKNACRTTWRVYAKHAMPHDELSPLTLGWKNTFGAFGATMVDGLGTLWLMGLEAEFYDAVREVARINWTEERYLSLNVFETTIRYLGGLLSAYDLSSVPVLLDKAVELADMLLVAFDTPNRMPPFWFSYERARSGRLEAGSNQGAATAASLSLEFTRLAQITGQSEYYDAVHRVTLFLARVQDSTLLPGMWPEKIDYYDEWANGTFFTLGANADSMYEYLIKMHILLGGTETLYRDMYVSAAETARRTLLFRPMAPAQDKEDDKVLPSDPGNVLLVGSAQVTFPGAQAELVPDMQHLSCFAGGMFGLGGKILGDTSHVEVGERIARGCAWMYRASPHGVMPEIAALAPCPSAETGVECAFNLTTWQDAGGGVVQQGSFTGVPNGKYILRPEAIESLFVMWRITGRAQLQDMAWEMWLAIANATETGTGAYAAVKDVMVEGEMEKDDSMESFWVAETLKYFFLIFSPPDLVSLDDYVFNTEAHPLRRVMK